VAGKIHFTEIPAAIQEAIKSTKTTLPHEELIMGFIAPEGLAESQLQTIAREITQKVAPGAQPFVGPAGTAAGGAQTEALIKTPLRILGFKPTPKMLG
jgi:hypothetical protein